MKHAFHSPAPDLGAPDLIYGDEWNDVHVEDPREISSDDVQLSTDDFIEATGGVIGITYTLLPPSGRKGRRVGVIKVDSGAGPVTIAGTINGDAAGYVLVNQYQRVEVQVRKDESGHLVVGNN
jgi:hypothetical protein